MISSIFSLHFHVISSDGSRKKFLSHFPADKGAFFSNFLTDAGNNLHHGKVIMEMIEQDVIFDMSVRNNDKSWKEQGKNEHGSC